MVDDAHLVEFAGVVTARRDDGRRFRLLDEVVVKTDASAVEGLGRQSVAQLDGQRRVVLRHASGEQLDARIPTNGRAQHVAPARFEL